MKLTSSTRITTAVTAGLLWAAGLGMAQTTVFNDNFSGGSTLNSATPGAPTASSTSYESVSTLALSSSSLSAGHLSLGVGTTSGNGYQAQALFASSPIALVTVGDYLQLAVTFTDSGGFMTTSNGTLCLGMYNSGGSYPFAGGVANENSANTDKATGGAQGWIGYGAQLTTNHTYFLTRLAQTGAGNNNQDLIFGGANGSVNSTSKGYNNPPPGAGLTAGNGSTFLTQNGQYTMVLSYELAAAGTLAITNSLYLGADTSGTLLSSYGLLVSGAAYLTNSFDGLTFGLYANKLNNTATDINQILVSDFIQPVPEPSVYALTGLGLLLLARRLRRQ